MKRSEMIKLIIDKLFYGKLAESARSDIRPKFITDLAEQDAESILKKLEEAGMLPPANEGIIKIEEGEDGQLFIPIWRWEEEEEEEKRE